MARQNFTTATLTARLKHAGGVCEWTDPETKIRCTTVLIPGRWHGDHDDPDAMTGKPTFENCRALCLYHHKLKTANDMANIAEAKRREALHLGSKAPTKQPIKSAGFPAKPKREPKPMPARRAMFEDRR